MIKYKLTPSILWSLILLAPIPFLLFLLYFITGLQRLDQLENEMERINTRASRMQEIQQQQSTVLASLHNPEPHYLEKNIESLTFLLSEIKKIEAIQAENGGDENLNKRLKFLKEGDNRLVFSEEQIRSNASFREIEEKQQHSVELNEEDLKKILCLMEGVTIWPYGPKEGRPQLIIKDFKLSKKEISSAEKVYVISMDCIKRENLEPTK